MNTLGEDIIITGLISLFIGTIIGIFISIKTPVWSTGELGARLIQECQKDLPRSQECVLIAVPAKEK